MKWCKETMIVPINFGFTRNTYHIIILYHISHIHFPNVKIWILCFLVLLNFCVGPQGQLSLRLAPKLWWKQHSSRYLIQSQYHILFLPSSATIWTFQTYNMFQRKKQKWYFFQVQKFRHYGFHGSCSTYSLPCLKILD